MLINHRTGLSVAIILFSSSIFLGFFCAPSLDAAPRGKGDFNVVRIIDSTGELRYEIVENDILPYLKKELDQEYKAAKKTWTEARKAWKVEHGKGVPFVQPEPIKPNFKVVAKGLSSRSDAKIEKEAQKSKGPYCVVQIVQGKKKERPEIILKDEVKLKKYAIEMDYFQNVQDWAKEKKEFAKSNPEDAFEKSLPDKPQLKVLKSSFKTLEKANAYLSKYEG